MTCEMRELGVVKIATPCRAKWSAMRGDDRVRFCGECQLMVYNLSSMTSDEARTLIQAKEGKRLCVRFWARKDGTVLTRDCPVGIMLRRWLIARDYLVLASLLAFVTGGLITLFGNNIRALFGASTGALVCPDAPVLNRTQTAYPTKKPPPKYFQIMGEY